MHGNIEGKFGHTSQQCTETSRESSGPQSLATQAPNARKHRGKVRGLNHWPPSFGILSMFPDYTNPADRPHRHPGFVSTLLQEVNQFDYLGLRLDPMMTMKAAV